VEIHCNLRGGGGELTFLTLILVGGALMFDPIQLKVCLFFRELMRYLG